MSRVFTGYVRSLDPVGEPPGVASLEKLLAALRRVVRRELRNRGLWDVPPSYLGVYGSPHWLAADGAAAGEADALDELVASCYSYVFVRRLRNLLVHLVDKPSIDGLVVLGVRNFLYETQKKHDPLGFRVFQVLVSALEAAVTAGELFVLAGDPRIRNDTVLGFGADTDPRVLPAAELQETVSRWNESLLPDLVTARGKALERTIADLRGFVLRLSDDGVAGFRFKELVDPLKNDVRSRWAARLELEDGETAVEGGGEELTARNNLAVLLQDRGDLAAAEPLLRENLELRRRLYGPDHPGVAVALNNLAFLLELRGSHAEAEPLYREAIAIFSGRLGEEHSRVAMVLRNLATLLEAKGDAAAAEAVARRAVEIFRHTLPEGHWRVADAESVLGGCLVALGRHEEAEDLLVGSYPVIVAAMGEKARQAREARQRLDRLPAARHRFAP